MDINKEIKKVQNYFIRKILKGEFEEKKRDSYCVTILIDGYQFIIWTGSCGYKFVSTYNNCFGEESTLIQLEFDDTQKKKIYDLLCSKK